MKSTNKWITVCHAFTSSTEEVRILEFVHYDMCCFFFSAVVTIPCVFVIA